ncbi:peptidoglycan/xylan/chitin deacetylase (PgdA/CDA1 family) [Virgibacillus natechei]|uniref:Peptidoglycan/xylan/chitin deacetylase (PgdA/CDA1 family) n=1 Tax=Virgibacillus natechei TaxID=1216297 RepID=A0ABS4ILD6_9BACI|nr:polysaccharide deacetylase family protein [Virgibacillus natechei]MBP1970824.1 peptidoglycan/xylan/chitin deacetylase (PgdA/CDA1 family) [Virgibacillus natechei]UZD12284.1 polysaccharide deacetylase family protein [Virgibacillus natechei]
MKYIFVFISFLFLAACGEGNISEPDNMNEKVRNVNFKEVSEPELDLAKFDREPSEWGENVTGVKNRFITEENEIALTFDACGGDLGNGYDEALIEFLREAEVPATLFVNQRWISANKEIFLELVDDPLFQIENHGTTHAPLSVDGSEAWDIPGTASAEEVFAEIMDNHETVKEITGRDMKLFRSGTAFYDEVAVELANALGYEVVNFDILGDAGATFSATQVEQALLNAEAGSIALLHMNQPSSGTAQGVRAAVEKLKASGFEFVQLADQDLE